MAADGGFVYDADSYADDLPYYSGTQLIVPYALDTNDMRFAAPQGFNSGTQFFDYLGGAFYVFYAEGEVRPKMLSVGLHCRLMGRPARIASLARFIEHVRRHDRLWIAFRLDIAGTGSPRIQRAREAAERKPDRRATPRFELA